MLADSLFQVAIATAISGARVLFVSPLNDQLAFRQHKFGRRVPLLSLKASAKTPSHCGGHVAWSTPEELESVVISRAFGVTGPDLIFVEEAQCASPLLSAYRPSFKNLERVLHRYPRAHTLFSASISSLNVRHDASQLFARTQLAEDYNFRKESALLDCPYLTLQVDSTIHAGHGDASDQLGRRAITPELLQLITDMPRPAVVFSSTVAEADAVYSALAAEQLPVHRFHAGLPEAERASQLLQFSLPGRRALMIAVSGFFPSSGLFGEPQGDVPENFGPGYTRRDIRSLVHLSAPASVEQYAMELRMLAAGPATTPIHISAALDEEASQELPVEADAVLALGPDEADQNTLPVCKERSVALIALLIYEPSQLALTAALLEKKRSSPEGLLALARTLADCGGSWVDERTLTRHGIESRKQLRACAHFLLDAGHIETRLSHGHIELRVKSSAAQLLRQAEEIATNLERLRNGDLARLNQVAKYAEGEDCRRLALNALLGRDDGNTQLVASSCGRCDRCMEKQASKHARPQSPSARASRTESSGRITATRKRTTSVG